MNATDDPTTTAPEHARSPHVAGRLTDSPLFWICTFASVALWAVVALEPKFRQREARLETNMQMREHVGELRLRGGGTTVDPTFAIDDEPIKTVRPLVLVLSATVAVSWGLLFWKRFVKAN